MDDEVEIIDPVTKDNINTFIPNPYAKTEGSAPIPTLAQIEDEEAQPYDPTENASPEDLRRILQENKFIHEGGSTATFDRTGGQTPYYRELRDTPSPAGFATGMGAGTIEDPAAKLEYYAGKRFPGMPKEDAVARYGYIDGQPVYVGEDGKLNRESGLSTGFGEVVGGNLPTIAGDIIGGMRFGPTGGIVGGAIGTMGRKKIGTALGDRRSLQNDAVDVIAESVLGWLGFKGAQKAGIYTFNKGANKDLANLDVEQATQLRDYARDELGITLTPAEATDLGSLINQETAYTTSLDDTATIVRAFLKDRVGSQIRPAIEKEIGDKAHPATLGEQARSVGASAIKEAKDDRAIMAGPVYDEFVNDGKRIIPIKAMKNLQTDPVMKKAFAQVRNEGLFVDDATADNSIKMVDAVIKQLQDDISIAARAGSSGKMTALIARKNKLLDIAYKAEPGYKLARETFAKASPEVNRLEGGMAGVLANINNSALEKVGYKLFNPKVSPFNVSEAKVLFEQAGKATEFRDLFRAYMRDVWETTATKETMTGNMMNAGAKFRSAMFASDRHKDIAKAALGKDFKSFQKFMDVLEATGRVTRGGSQTAGALAYAEREAAEQGGLVSKIKPIKIVSGQMIRDFFADKNVQEYRKQMATIITSARSLERMRELLGLDPTSAKAIGVVGDILAETAYSEAEQYVEKPADQMPEALQYGP